MYRTVFFLILMAGCTNSAPKPKPMPQESWQERSEPLSPEISQESSLQTVASNISGRPAGLELSAAASWMPQIALDSDAVREPPVLKIDLSVSGERSRSVVAIGEVLVDSARTPVEPLLQTAAVSFGLDRSYEVIPPVLVPSSATALVTTIPLELESPAGNPESVTLTGTAKIVMAEANERLEKLTISELKSLIAEKEWGDLQIQRSAADEPQVVIQTNQQTVLRDWSFTNVDGTVESNIWTQEEFDPRDGGTVILGSSGELPLDELRISCAVAGSLATQTVNFEFSHLPVPPMPQSPGISATKLPTRSHSEVASVAGLQVYGRAQKTPLMGLALDTNSLEFVLDVIGSGLDTAIAAGELKVTSAITGGKQLELGDPVRSVDLRRRIVSLEELGQTLKRRWELPMNFPVDGPVPEKLDEISGQLTVLLANSNWLQVPDAFTPGADRLHAIELPDVTFKLERFDGNQFILVAVGADASRVGRLTVIDEHGRRLRTAQSFQTTLPGAVEYSIGFETGVPPHAGIRLEWFLESTEQVIPFRFTNVPVVQN